ncbi:MAG TPA: DivIVA domain-containing protein [Gaiellaceae bacterium]|jgi:DivIVA domain-containing protein
MFIAPAEVQDQKLKGRLRGYNKAAVEKLLQDVVASYEQVWQERDQLRSRVEALEQELAPLRDAERLLSGSLFAAERAAADVRALAEKEASELLAQGRAEGKAQQTEMDARRTWLENEINRLELVERELQTSLRAFLLAGLELVEDREASRPAQVVEVPLSNPETPDPAPVHGG